jgi:Tol biopolymer transport system component
MRRWRSIPEMRWQSAGQLRAALEATRKKRLPYVAIAIGVAAIVAIAGLVIWLRGQNRREDFSPVAQISLSGKTDAATFSPDGNRVAFPYLRADAGNKSGIYVKQVGGGPPVRLTTDESDLEPSWSPDDRSIVSCAAPVPSDRSC